MKLYQTKHGPVVEAAGKYALLDDRWDDLVCRDDLLIYLKEKSATAKTIELTSDDILAPIETQEVWAAGVTYFRSRTARMEESSEAGGSDFYDRVYNAHRPELFFKATPHRVIGTGGKLKIRSDSKWNVPEPELTLAITPGGRIIGYTIGNDLSSRDIEGENPLYLPQAKVFDACAGLGPCLLISEERLPAETAIRLEVRRGEEVVFSGDTQLSQMKQTLDNLVEHLIRDNSFPRGCLLMTGTGIVPTDDFTLHPGDEVRIWIDSIGELVNTIA